MIYRREFVLFWTELSRSKTDSDDWFYVRSNNSLIFTRTIISWCNFSTELWEKSLQKCTEPCKNLHCSLSYCGWHLIIIIIIIIFIYCNWVVTRWQWLFYIWNIRLTVIPKSVAGVMSLRANDKWDTTNCWRLPSPPPLTFHHCSTHPFPYHRSHTLISAIDIVWNQIL